MAGLKRYFHAKRSEGLLSMEGLRILDYACDVAADRALGPLVSHRVWALTSQLPVSVPGRRAKGQPIMHAMWVGTVPWVGL